MRNRQIADKIEWIQFLQTLMTEHPDAKEGIEERIADVKREIRRMYKAQEDPLEKSLLQGGRRNVCEDPEEPDYLTFWCEPDDPFRDWLETAEYVDNEYSYPCRYPGGPFTRVWFIRNQCGLWIIQHHSMDI